MAIDALTNALIEQERDVLLVKWRGQVRLLPSAQDLDTPTLNDHVPSLLQELAAALKARSDETIAEALVEGSPPAHGIQRVKDAFDIEEVVAEYNILRDCIHDLAEKNGIILQGAPFHILNRVLDGAIGLAVRAFATQRALDVQHRREEYLAFVAHDLRTPLNAISLAECWLTHPMEHLRGNARDVEKLRRNVQHSRPGRKVLEENTISKLRSASNPERRTFDLAVRRGPCPRPPPVSGTASTQLVNGARRPGRLWRRRLLRRVFQNLIANAIRYTPNGVVSSGRDLGAAGAWSAGSATTAGIPEAELEKVFDKLRRTPKRRRGGLGLAIVKMFVEAHDGKVNRREGRARLHIPAYASGQRARGADKGGPCSHQVNQLRMRSSRNDHAGHCLRIGSVVPLHDHPPDCPDSFAARERLLLSRRPMPKSPYRWQRSLSARLHDAGSCSSAGSARWVWVPGMWRRVVDEHGRHPASCIFILLCVARAISIPGT